jgi:serine/threonine-protein kinase
MAPKEFRRGATIDERTMVHTLGRMALVYLGCARKSEPLRDDFRGTDGQFAVAMHACAADPADRIQSVRELHLTWRRHSPT